MIIMAVQALISKLSTTWHPGTYYNSRVDEYGHNRTGNYTLHTYNPVDDHSNTRTRATPLSLHSPLTASINPGTDVDYFRVQVGATSATTALNYRNNRDYGYLRAT